jgi:tRNA(Arg) A34 adenosine deaminase TadA
MFCLMGNKNIKILQISYEPCTVCYTILLFSHIMPLFYMVESTKESPLGLPVHELPAEY